jgi:hypothetical protein
LSPTRSTLLLGALALAFAAAADDRGKLLGIKAGGDAEASAVLIFADRPLSFTTMKLADPPRVVVDFADTGIASARRELTVEDGTVRRVAMATAGARTARVVVELEADAEFDVRTVRNEVELRIARPSALASAEKGGSATPQQATPLKPPEQAAAKPPEQGAAKPPEQGAAKPPEQAAAKPPEQGAARPPEQAAAKPPEQAAAKPPAPSESAPKQPAAEPPPPLPATASSSQSEPARTSPPPAATAKAPRAVPPSAPPSKPQPQTQTQTQTGPGAAPRTSSAEAAKIASLPKVSLVGSAPASSAPAAKSGTAHANITGVGFRPVGAGEVIVRSDHPLTCDVTADGKAVLLHLPGARIPLPNNRRPLDTHFFDGAVQRIVPLAVAGGTDVRIELREPAEYKLEQSGAVLTVTFSSPR